MAFAYAPKLRPPTRDGLPRFEFELLERPHFGFGFDRRTDLPASSHQFGVVGFKEKLSADDVEHFDLEYLGER